MGKKERLLEKLKKVRRDQWIVLLLCGILIIVLSLPAPRDEEQQEPIAAQTMQTDQTISIPDMESRLESILCQMEGAGQVRVMITQKDTGEKIVEKDRSDVNRTTQEQNSDGTARSTVEQENQETTIYDSASGGDGAPYVTQQLAPQVEGVLVLAQGADNASVKKEITDAVMALFGLEAHKIKVVKMNERRG